MTETDIGFIVRRISDEAFELLDPEDQLRVENGQQVVIENSGNTRVLEIALEEGVETSVGESRVTIPAGIARWIQDDVEVPSETLEIDGRKIKIYDLTETDKKLTGLKRRLNGGGDKADALVRNSIMEGLVNGGVVHGARTVDAHVGGSQILAMQTGGANDTRRVSGFFTMPTEGSNIAYKVAKSTYLDCSKATSRIESIA